jgi:hypothetical protein
MSGIIVFFKFVASLLQTYWSVSDSNDIAVSLGLYVVYPAVLWLLLDKFHGLCGKEAYLQKEEALAACKSLFLWFTVLLRTYKLWVMILNKADASGKEGSSRHLDMADANAAPSSGGGGAVAGMRKHLKCQTWMHLVQELATIGAVVFLLFICLPVLAFWFMLISILVSLCNLWTIGKRVWNESQESSPDGNSSGENQNEDVEFQEFLSNFADDDDDDDDDGGEETNTESDS